MKAILKTKDKAMATEITRRIRCEVLRKCVRSSCVSGFSGVSSGHKMRIKTADKTDSKIIYDE